MSQLERRQIKDIASPEYVNHLMKSTWSSNERQWTNLMDVQGANILSSLEMHLCTHNGVIFSTISIGLYWYLYATFNSKTTAGQQLL